MIELKSFKFNNIRGFTTEQEISLENRDKIIQVDGENRDTGGSSGAGKSTVLLALDYLLGISDKTATILQSWLTKESIYVSGEFVIDGKPVTITRSKKNGLTIVTPDETISGNVKLAEEKLDQLIGIPRKIFKKMIHKRQKDGGFFLSLTAKESFEFLVTVLGLGEYLKDLEYISTDIKDIKADIEKCSTQIQYAEDSKKELEEIFSNKTLPQCTVTIDQIKSLQNEVEVLSFHLGTVEQSFTQQINQITSNPPKKRVVEFDKEPEIALEVQIKDLENQQALARKDHQEKLKAFQEGKAKLQTKLNTIHHSKVEMEKIVNDIADLKDQRSKVQESSCPTCEQHWAGPGATAEIERLNTSIAALGKNALELRSTIAEEHETNLKLDRITTVLNDTYNNQPGVEYDDQLEDLRSQLSQLQTARGQEESNAQMDYLKKSQEYTEKLLEIKNKKESETKDLKEQLHTKQMQLNNARLHYDSYLNNKISYDKERAALDDQLARKNRELITEGQKRQTLKQKLLVAEESKRCLKAYVLQIFQDTLDMIGDIATDLLAGIPNMANSTVYFEGCKETKTGTLKDEIEVIINKGGVNKIPVKALCGGEETAIELAIDLAVIDVIEARANKGMNIFIADEPFNGLDSICKEQCLHIISRYNTNKKIIMVDHSSELKEAVSDTITVIKENENSRIA